MSKPITPLQQVEAFHAALLGELRLPRGHSAVKGGVNLRMFFGSPRMSKDLDIDVDAKTPAAKTLAKNVTKVLEGTTLRGRLAKIGISIVAISAPKQTDAVQCWKVALRGPAGDTPTKIEFSRRGLDLGIESGNLDPNVAAAYSLPGAIVEHYGRQAAYAQKLRALASRMEPQARDVFDLHILGPRITPASMKGIDREAALTHLLEISFTDFRSQVVPTLEPSVAEHYDNEQVWEAMVMELEKQLTDPSSGSAS